jgi:ABC-type nickel/cobalt efflux system permease component RcnA
VKRFVALAAVVLGLLAVLPAVAKAHPLGNFTTNQYTELVASGDRLYILSVLDLAEVPTFQAEADRKRLGNATYANRLASVLRDDLAVTVDGRALTLTQLERRIVFPRGVAGLATTRLEVVLDAGPLTGSSSAAIENRAFASRIGWREIVVRAERGASVDAAGLPATSASDRLRTYPEDLLRSPLDVRAARFTVDGSSSPGVAPTLGNEATAAPERTQGGGEGGFASLVEREDLSVGFILVALVLAMFWGAAHALTPGHGKAIVAAYLIGTKGRARDALALGGIVTVTHTIGVFALGIATLALSEFVVPEDLYPWMNLVSALLVVAVGVVVLRERVRAAVGHGPRHGHNHHHDHAHGHHHHGHHHHHEGMPDEEHARAHLPEQGTGARGLLAVGISGGLLPCPTALVVLLAAISLHHVAFGLVLIVAFSIGLASVISAIGFLAIGARTTFRRMSSEGSVVRALPAVSALLVFGTGLVMTARAVPQLL